MEKLTEYYVKKRKDSIFKLRTFWMENIRTVAISVSEHYNFVRVVNNE
jgi:hypothetical protein